MAMSRQFVIEAQYRRHAAASDKDYSHSLPAIRSLKTLKLHPSVTFFVGENGSGKSTLLEALAVACGFNAEGGGRNFTFSSRASHSDLHLSLKIIRGIRRPRTGYFLRAESFYNVASDIDARDEVPGFDPPIIMGYGGVSLHKQSHGESFMALLTHRFMASGLYFLDEPEAALSPTRQMTALARINELAKAGAQFVIATHSPILMAYPRAKILLFAADGLREVEYTETEHYQLTKSFLDDHETAMRHILARRPSETDGSGEADDSDDPD